MTEGLKNVIGKRISMHPEYDFGINECWREALQLVKENPETVVIFVNNDATDEEVYWL